MAVTNLTGYTWVANNIVSITNSTVLSFSITFTDSTNSNYSSLSYALGLDGLPSMMGGIKYGAVGVYSDDWFDEVYKTIHITGGDDVDDTTLIAWLEANGTLSAGYEVTFVTNGGTSVTKLEYVEELPTPLPTTTKINNIFVGWFYDSGFEVQAFSGDTISSNITLYAKWYANMSDFYKDIADAIRSKNGETEPIKHTDFAYKIKNILDDIETALDAILGV